jgi:hypothetical protein
MSRTLRSLLLAGLGLGAAMLAYVVVGGHFVRVNSVTPGSTGGSPSVGVPSPHGGGTRPTAPASTAPASGTPLPGHTDPVAVAKAFALADQAWSWQDQPDPDASAIARADVWSTPAWAAVMGGSSGASYLTAQRIAAHEVDTVTVDSVVQQDPSTATSKTELVLSTVTVTKDGATPAPSTGYLQLTVVLQPDGNWAVDKVQI